MARDEFLDNLRMAYRQMSRPSVRSDLGAAHADQIARLLHSADLWLTPMAVGGFNPDDFPDWPEKDRRLLERSVKDFLEIAKDVPPNSPATKEQSKQARKNLEKAMQIVREHILADWLNAQRRLIAEAKKAADAKGWSVKEDDKEILESLLGSYRVPRIRIRTPDK